MILGIDAATIKSGWAILHTDGSLVNYGTFKTNSKEPLERIREVYIYLEDILAKYDIDIIVAEDVPLNRINNLKIGKDLSVLQGVILSLCFKYDLKFQIYNPTSWRGIIGMYNGTREGTKRDFQKCKAVEVVNDIYGLDLEYFKNSTKTNESDDDEAEAILIARAYILDLEKKR